MRKTIDEMAKQLQQHNLTVPENARSVKFEEESLNDFSEDPAEEPFVVTDEEESENSLSTSKQPSEQDFRSNTEDEE
jgi:hypothetical protein